MYELILAEKASVAKTIAGVLGANRKEGYYEGKGYIVTNCVGHLLSAYEPNEYDVKYKKWRLEDMPIIPEEFKYKPGETTEKQLKLVIELIKRKDVTAIINACDCGREGEKICMDVYHYAHCKKPVKRLWISSLEEKAISDGFKNLKPGTDYENLYKAAVCREHADWLVGMNYTRNFSILYNSDVGVLSIGRVQTPTLAMIVKREQEIRNFIKVPFFVPQITGEGFTAEAYTAEKDRIFEKNKADAIAAQCNGKTAKVTLVERKEKSEGTPRLFDLTNLQKEANKLFGYTAEQTLKITQGLYESKILTYPRTDSQFITDDMAQGIPQLIEKISSMLLFTVQGESKNISAIVNNAKVSDHHAIIPTPTAATTDLTKLSDEEKNILFTVCTRLLTATGVKHTFAETTVKVNCEGHEFKTKGKTVINNGWKTIEEAFHASIGRTKKEVEKALPQLTEGQEYTAEATVREGANEPKKHYTEATLLAAMETAGIEDMPEDAERKGIGTPATRASIIENLIKKSYIVRDKKNILCTEKAENLMKVLPDSDPVKEPKLTGEWETDLKLIEKGEYTAESFMERIVEFVTKAIQENNSPTEEGKRLFPPKQNSDGGASSGKEVICKCPRCGSDVIEMNPSFGCIGYKNGCKYALWKEGKFGNIITNAKKKITPAIAKSLMTNGKVHLKGMMKKEGEKYDATIVCVDDGKGALKLEFEKRS